MRQREPEILERPLAPLSASSGIEQWWECGGNIARRNHSSAHARRDDSRIFLERVFENCHSTFVLSKKRAKLAHSDHQQHPPSLLTSPQRVLQLNDKE
jgi:hypothetical protein